MIELLKRILAYLTGYLAGLRQENERLKKELAKIKEWVDKIYEATKKMSTIEKLEEIYKRVVPPAPPTIRGVISSSQILSLFSEIFPSALDKIFIADSQYEITAISEIRRFIEWDNVNIFPYVSEFHDCDDFALALAGDFAKYPGWSGFPVTFMWGSYFGGHAFCTAVAWRSFEERVPVVFFIEPQNDWEIARESLEGSDLWLLPMRKIERRKN